MAFNLANAANTLKVRYLGPIRENVNNSTILLSRIARDDMSANVSGKSFTIPLHTGRNDAAGVGRADGATLPTAGQQAYTTCIVPNAYLYSRIQVTGPTIQAARDSAGAFVQAIESEVQGLIRDTKKAMNRQLHGDGRDALGFLSRTLTSATAAFMDDGQGNPFTLLNYNAMTVDLIDAADHTTVLSSANTATLGAAGSTDVAVTLGTAATGNSGAAADYIVPSGSLGRQMIGIRGIIDDSDPPDVGGLFATGLQGLAVATNQFWKAQVNGASGTKRDLQLALMQKPIDAIAQNSDFNENDIKFMLGSYGVRGKFVDLLLSEKRFVNNTILDGGFTAVMFNTVPFVVDSQVRRNCIYYICPDSMKIYRTSDFDWMEKDGAVLSRVANTDAYEAVLFHYGNLGVGVRNANGLLEDINE